MHGFRSESHDGLFLAFSNALHRKSGETDGTSDQGRVHAIHPAIKNPKLLWLAGPVVDSSAHSLNSTTCTKAKTMLVVRTTIAREGTMLACAAFHDWRNPNQSPGDMFVPKAGHTDDMTEHLTPSFLRRKETLQRGVLGSTLEPCSFIARTSFVSCTSTHAAAPSSTTGHVAMRPNLEDEHDPFRRDAFG